MRYLTAILCALAVAAAQGLYGGVLRPVFALPAFALLGVAGVLGGLCFFRGKTPEPHFFCLLLVAALGGWLLWREVESPDVWLASGYFRLTLACLVVYLLFACVITNPYHRLAFVTGLLLLAMVQAVLAGWQFVNVHDGFPIPWLSEQLRQWYSPRFSRRAHGFYLNGNHLAWFLNTAGITALSLACWGRWRATTKVLCFYIALVSFAGSMLTISRGGIVSLAAGLAVFFLLSALALTIGARDRRLAALLLLLTGLAATGSIFGWIFQSSARMQDRFSGLLTDSYRPEVLPAAARQFQLDPIYGTGAGTFSYYVRQFREFPISGDDFFVHNDWVQLAADFGYPALALLVAAVVLHFVVGLGSLMEILRQRMVAYSRPQSHAAALLIAALASVTVFAVHSAFDFNMQIPANAVLAAAFFGMLANSRVEMIGARVWWKGLMKKIPGYAGVAICGAWLLAAVWRAGGTEFYLLKAENALLAGQWEEGADMARKGLAGGRSSPGLRGALGESYLLQSLALDSPMARWRIYQLAVKEFSEVARLVPLAAGNRILLARALDKAGRLERAEHEILEAIRLSPGKGESYRLYAQLLERTGRLDEAARFYLISGQYHGNPHWGLDFDTVQKKLRLRTSEAGQ